MGSGRVNKIFIVGFNKSGTKTLHGFFKANGIPSIHYHGGRLARTMMLNACADRPILHGYDRKYRVFSDMIFISARVCIEGNSFFPILDRDYPGSKFIYNTRPEDDWIRSRLTHADGSFFEQYRSVLNTDSRDKVVAYWRAARKAFEGHLFDYFSGRNDLFTYRIGESTPESLSTFLEMDLDLSLFEWLNRSGAGRDRPGLLEKGRRAVARLRRRRPA